MTACGRPGPRPCGAPGCPNRAASGLESGRIMFTKVLSILTLTGGHPISIRVLRFVEYAAVVLLRLNVGRSDDLTPLLGFFDDELTKVGRRPGNRRNSQFG